MTALQGGRASIPHCPPRSPPFSGGSGGQGACVTSGVVDDPEPAVHSGYILALTCGLRIPVWRASLTAYPQLHPRIGRKEWSRGLLCPPRSFPGSWIGSIPL